MHSMSHKNTETQSFPIKPHVSVYIAVRPCRRSILFVVSYVCFFCCKII